MVRCFHDRSLDICRRKPGTRITELADALQLTNLYSDNWYNATNYAESHDEVGNLNFDGLSGWKGLDLLTIPDGIYRELWNSSWPAFAIPGEGEQEHTNGGRDARLSRSNSLHIPAFGASVLQ